MSKKRILFVDDEEMLRDWGKAVLKNYEIKTAFDGVSALEAFQSSPYDLVITDMKMPNMNGADFLTKVREISQIPCILLTGDPTSCESDSYEVVGKPLTNGELKEIVQKMIGE